MRDLFDPHPCDGLASVVAEIDVHDPWSSICARMSHPNCGFGRSGNAASQVVFGFGIEGRGSSADEAARDWLKSAHTMMMSRREGAIPVLRPAGQLSI